MTPASLSRRTLISASLLSGAGAVLLSSCSSAKGKNEQAPTQMFTWVSSESDRAQWQAFVDAVKETDPSFKLDFSGSSAERRVGKECSRRCRSRWSTYH